MFAMFRPWTSKARGPKGLTLAEVMVALMILTVAIFGLIGARLYALRARSVTVERRAAVVLAAAALEEAERSLRHDFKFPVAMPRAAHPTEPRFEMEVLSQPHASMATLKRVEVAMYWRDRNGAQQHKVWTWVYDRAR